MGADQRVYTQHSRVELGDATLIAFWKMTDPMTWAENGRHDGRAVHALHLEPLRSQTSSLNT
jgi:hypothetical protein